MMLPCFDGFALTSVPSALRVSRPPRYYENSNIFAKAGRKSAFPSALCFLIHETAKISERPESDRSAGWPLACWCARNILLQKCCFKTDLIGRDLCLPKYDSQARSHSCESTCAHILSLACIHTFKAARISRHNEAAAGVQCVLLT